MFAFGSLVFKLLSCERPFPGNQKETRRRTLELRYNVQGRNWAQISKEATDFVRQLLVHREERLTATNALSHHWFDDLCMSFLDLEESTIPASTYPTPNSFPTYPTTEIARLPVATAVQISAPEDQGTAPKKLPVDVVTQLPSRKWRSILVVAIIAGAIAGVVAVAALSTLPDWNNSKCVEGALTHPTKAGDANLLVNGSFESNFVAPGSWQHIDVSDVIGWEPYGNTAVMEIWGKGHLGVQPSDGDHFVGLDAQAGFYQDIPNVEGKRYLLEFYMRARSQELFDRNGGNVIVEWCGAKPANDGYRAANWEHKSAVLEGSGGSCRLVIRAGSTSFRGALSDGVVVLVDNVSLTALS